MTIISVYISNYKVSGTYMRCTNDQYQTRTISTCRDFAGTYHACDSAVFRCSMSETKKHSRIYSLLNVPAPYCYHQYVVRSH